MIRVRATQDGTYAGYVWEGPKEQQDGTYTPGDVFDVDEKPFPLKDEYGNPVQEMEATGQIDDRGQPLFKKAWMNESGKLKRDSKGNPIPKIKMTTFFSPVWMMRVPDDTELTFPDRVIPFPILEPYRLKQPKVQKTVALPPEVAAAAGMTQGTEAESPI